MTRKASLPLTTALIGAAALAASACSSEHGGGLHLLSNGPGLPEECDVCWEEFKECFAAGEDAEVCEAGIIECVIDCKAPAPPPECDHCVAGYEACIATAGTVEADPGDCAAGLESCLHACEHPAPSPDGECEQGRVPGDPNDHCEEGGEDCMSPDGEECERGGDPGGPTDDECTEGDGEDCPPPNGPDCEENGENCGPGGW